MKNILKHLTLGATLATAMAFAQAPAAKDAKTPAATAKSAPKAATVAQSDSDIASAKAKGMVWVNTNTKVYHKDGEFYGKTKQGKFMMEADAQKAGFRAAQLPSSKKKTTAKK